ncbi:MAG: N-acetylglucosamine-6-phosphate deacetylase [Nitriliruptoraceae bacterium]|nr:N-acetylglucosamine-6-phosphate deacetylase [Nitriliruptoraceae bacterium]
MSLLQAPTILLDGALQPDGWVQVEGTRIVAVGTGSPPLTAGRRVELPEGTLSPGLVDAQCNGAFGHDLVDADLAGWHEVATRLPSTGVTAVVPTFITAPVATLADALRRFRHLDRQLEGPGLARRLGVHLEGPFLAPTRRGAHREQDLVDPDPTAIDTLLDAADGALTYVTLAPERRGAIAAIERLAAAGVSVAVGHSDATDAQVGAAADAGARLVTHLYNAQRPLHHRDPGVVGAALTDPRLTSGLIVDLHHVHPHAVLLAFTAATGRIMLVTDAIAALGMPPGRFELGGEEVHLEADRPPRRSDGAIAGSALAIDAAVRNAVAIGIPLATALTAATRIPATALGHPELGRLAPGAPADLVWLDDGLHVAATWVDGHLAHGELPGATTT